MNKTVSIYHHRSIKSFERFCKKNNIQFKFIGYGCGYYDPSYRVNWSAEFTDCKVDVWLERIGKKYSSSIKKLN